MTSFGRLALAALFFGFSLFNFSSTANAEDVLCDPAFEDCRFRLLTLIRNETSAIDVAFWFMEDNRYSTELIKKHQAGVRVRVIVDSRANATYALNADILAQLAAAGIPMRQRVRDDILHWKMMLFDAQNTIEFSAANYSPWAFVPIEPYVNYTDEAVYFTDEPSIVNSFRTKYDSLWVNSTHYADYANITTPPVRRYDIFPKDPELNFPPLESYRSRAVALYDAETMGMDVHMFRITDVAHSDAMIRAVQRGVPVRLLTDAQQYREAARLWHAWNVDRMYMAGVQVRLNAHQGVNHQKSVILKNLATVIWGSSNWTATSSDWQEEHNYFTKKLFFLNWFTDQFERKWNNLTGHIETREFVPLPPDSPGYLGPAHLSTNVATTGVVLRWHGGPWAHKYDIYFGTTSTPPLLQADAMLGPSESSTQNQQFALPQLLPGTTYYWRIVSKTAADRTAAGLVHAFTTAGTPPPPPPNGEIGEGDIVLYAGTATVKAGDAAIVGDATAAGGVRMLLPNANGAKLGEPLAAPTTYFEMTFEAQAGIPYRLWIRGKAQDNYWGNDSVYVQFSGAVSETGAPIWRIGTTGGTHVNLEDCGGCGLSGWGWQDNGWGIGVLGPIVQFETSGTQTIRFQNREDGLSIDQILLSPSRYLSTPPGALKNDTTIMPATGGSPPPDPEPDPIPGGDEVVLWAGRATTFAGAWAPVTLADAAGGVALRHPDAGAPKLNTALATPANYFEMTFNAIAGKPYRIWIRGRAQNDSWSNDSAFVQFSGSVNESGAPMWRIGTTDATWVGIEDGTGTGVAGWGWNDNGYGMLGALVYFETTGTHTIRIQTREDGLTIDQIVLSSGLYLSTAPGSAKNDATILPETTGGSSPSPDPKPEPEPAPESEPVPGGDEVVLRAGLATTYAGAWAPVQMADAAGGVAMRQPDAGAPKLDTPFAAPANYFELTFNAVAGKPYRIWIRGRADRDFWGNDSAFVQFSGSVDASGAPMWRIGTVDATWVGIEDGSGAGVAGWGWNDNGYGTLGSVVHFETTGTHTIRIQAREDGLTIDQIVLSSGTYLTTAPGAAKNDTTILSRS